MGLDIVEIVLRCEEHFAVSIKDEDAEQMRTVGDLYRLVCAGVGVTAEGDPTLVAGMVRRAKSAAPWTSEEVWATVRWVVVEQLQVGEEEVTPGAEFGRDLRAD